MAASSEFGNWQAAIDSILDNIQYSEVFQAFSRLQSNEARVKFIFHEKLMKQVKWLPTYFDACKKWHGKSIEVARVWKNKGNKFYQQKKYIEAVNAYTQSCLNASVDTGDDFSLSLGNRSAALFNLGFYQESIIDINRAIEHRFPAESLHKLLARKTSAYIKLGQKQEAENCIDSLKDFTNSKQFSLVGTRRDGLLKDVDCMERSVMNLNLPSECAAKDQGLPALSFGKNPVVSQATDALSLHFTDEKGRHLLANNQIPKGSTVIIEKPFAAVLLPEHYETHCHYCFSSLPLTVLGCKRCTSVRFCNEKCRDSAWSSYHGLECPYLDLFHSIGIAHLSLRIILCAGLDFLSDFVVHQFKYRKSNEVSSKGINSDGMYDRSYLTVYDLMTHEEKTLSQDMLQYSLTAALLLSTLVHAGFFSKMSSSGDSNQLEEHFKKLMFGASQDLPIEVFSIGGLLLRHILQLVCNAHAIISLQATTSGTLAGNTQDIEQVRIATAIYPTASLMNHSCDPTIISSFIGDVLIVKTVKEVEVGEEIFNCYGPHYCRMAREERQEVLKSQYHFDCKCRRCCTGDSSHLRFNAFKCPICAGVFSGYSCLECGHLLDEENIVKLASRMRQANKMFDDAIKIMNLQNYEDALNMLEECQIQRQSVLYRSHKDLAQTEDAIARCYSHMGDFSSSADHLFTSVRFTSEMYGEKSIEHANELQKLAEVLFNADRFTECLDMASQCLSLLQDLYSPGHETVRQVRELRDEALKVLTPLMQAN